MIEIRMPRLSDTMEDGAVSTWRKALGETVEVGDVLVEIETDKAVMEYEAYEAGVLTEILVAEGEAVPIGAVIARLGDGSFDSDVPPRPPVETDIEERRAERLLATPLVRGLAREYGIDLSTVTGSGPGGRIVRVDIEAAINENVNRTVAEPVKATATATKAGDVSSDQPPADVEADHSRTRAHLDDGDFEQLPLDQVRRTIARRLGESARTVPHYYVTAVADAEELVSLRARLNAQLLAAGRPKISVNDLLTRACALALRAHPLVNASYVEDTKPQLRVHRSVHIGVAVATVGGLMVPVIRDADRKPVGVIAAETKEFTKLANERRLTPDQLSGGTFTISNLGMYGVENFTAIINPPEGAILAVGALAREPVVVGDDVVARHRIRYTLSADHRIIDGALSAEFLATLTKLVEQPWNIVV
jgi:pyruvate dehydrogenase E2 component (dihydrolipoamide acetyltransferase)